jgi:hypothetical protein
LSNRYFGFGSDNDLESAHNYPIIEHAAFPVSAPDDESSHPDPAMAVPAAKVLGGARGAGACPVVRTSKRSPP